MFKTVGYNTTSNICGKSERDHNWTTVKDDRFSVYEECRAHGCQARRVQQRPGNYQPIDNNWLLFKRNNINV